APAVSRHAPRSSRSRGARKERRVMANPGGIPEVPDQPGPTPEPPSEPPIVPPPGPGPEAPGNVPSEAPSEQPVEIPVIDPPATPSGPANPIA
ncbi:hypothetical protein, partial [uncultured Methylobacterium sp.]